MFYGDYDSEAYSFAGVPLGDINWYDIEGQPLAWLHFLMLLFLKMQII